MPRCQRLLPTAPAAPPLLLRLPFQRPAVSADHHTAIPASPSNRRWSDAVAYTKSVSYRCDRHCPPRSFSPSSVMSSPLINRESRSGLSLSGLSGVPFLDIQTDVDTAILATSRDSAFSLSASRSAFSPDRPPSGMTPALDIRNEFQPFANGGNAPIIRTLPKTITVAKACRPIDVQCIWHSPEGLLQGIPSVCASSQTAPFEPSASESQILTLERVLVSLTSKRLCAVMYQTKAKKSRLSLSTHISDPS